MQEIVHSGCVCLCLCACMYVCVCVVCASTTKNGQYSWQRVFTARIWVCIKRSKSVLIKGTSTKTDIFLLIAKTLSKRCQGVSSIGYVSNMQWWALPVISHCCYHVYHNSVHGQFMCTKYGWYKCVHMWHLYHHNADQSAFKYSPGAVEVAESKYEEAKHELEEVISELQDDWCSCGSFTHKNILSLDDIICF